MSNYEFWYMACLEKSDPTNCGGRGDMVSTVQLRGITKKDGSTPTTTFLEWKEKEKKRQYWKRNLDME